MKRTFLFSAAALALAACGLGAPSYPEFQQTAYRLEGVTTSVNSGTPSRTVIYRDGPQMRVESMLPELGQATIVFDESTSGAYVLNPTGAGVQAPAPAAPNTQSQPAPQAQTGTQPQAPPAAAQPTIGVAVRVDNADAPQPLETAWAALGAENARHVGRCEVAGEPGREWAPRESPAGVERTACITDDGIVLRVRENEMVLWEATSLQRGPQDASLFGIPAGYQMIDPQAVADEVGANMEQLDSVTGAPPAPQPAPPPRG